MKSRLDQIESRLQSLIEGSLHLFPASSRQQLLAQKLIASLKELLQADPPQGLDFPEVYLILLHPDNLAFWQSNRAFLESVFQAVINGDAPNAPPIIQLTGDPGLALDDLKIVASNYSEASDQTAALELYPEEIIKADRPANAFLIIDGIKTYPLRESVLNIGRRLDNHLVIDDPRVSRAHAQLRLVHGCYVLFDLNSTGGTCVNGRRVTQHTLQPGDVIALAGVPLIYGEDAPHDPTDTGGQTAHLPADARSDDPSTERL